MLPKLVTALALGATVFGVASASAAGLSVTSGGVAQQSRNVTAVCDTDGVTITVETGRNSGTVTGVTVGNISRACQDADADIAARFLLADGSSVDSQQAKANANRVFLAIPLNRQPTVLSVDSTQITIADQIRNDG